MLFIFIPIQRYKWLDYVRAHSFYGDRININFIHSKKDTPAIIEKKKEKNSYTCI